VYSISVSGSRCDGGWWLTQTLNWLRVGYENTVVGMNHDFKHREARKLLNQTIGKGNVHRYDALVEAETLKLVASLMDAQGKEEIVTKIRQQVPFV
jgi:cytochrome P450